MKFNLGIENVESREEFLAIFAAIVAATPDDEQREADLFNAFYDCADELLKNLEPEELSRVVASLTVSLPEIAARRKKQAAEDRRLTRRDD